MLRSREAFRRSLQKKCPSPQIETNSLYTLFLHTFLAKETHEQQTSYSLVIGTEKRRRRRNTRLIVRDIRQEPTDVPHIPRGVDRLKTKKPR